MPRTIAIVTAILVCSAGVAYSAEKKADPKPKTIGEVVVDVVTAPIRLIQDLMKK